MKPGDIGRSPHSRARMIKARSAEIQVNLSRYNLTVRLKKIVWVKVIAVQGKTLIEEPALMYIDPGTIHNNAIACHRPSCVKLVIF